MSGGEGNAAVAKKIGNLTSCFRKVGPGFAMPWVVKLRWEGVFFASINQAKLDGRKRELVGWPFPVTVQSRSKGCVVSRSEEGLITTGCQV